MAEKIRIALDAMGGDNAPGEIVLGAVNAVRHNQGMRITLVGKEDQVQKALDDAKKALASGDAGRFKGKSGDAEDKVCADWESRIGIRNATEVIATSEHPVEAIMHKRDSSMVVALYMVKKGEADAAVSAGNSGAFMVGGQGIVGKIRGVQRPPFGTIIPTKAEATLLVDSGANVDARPQFLAQWAKIGSIYVQCALGIEKPKVGILNVGAEEEKGNQLVKDSFPLLKKMNEDGEINFIGSVEAREVPAGACDVLVCDGFAGNVLLKMYEGTAKVLLSVVKEGLYSSTRSKIGGLLIKPVLKKSLKKFDSSQYGGAPILGLSGLVVKTHGSAKAKEIERAMVQCVEFYDLKIADRITEYAKAEKAKQDAERAAEKAAKADAGKA